MRRDASTAPSVEDSEVPLGVSSIDKYRGNFQKSALQARRVENILAKGSALDPEMAASVRPEGSRQGLLKLPLQVAMIVELVASADGAAEAS
jgi:hypothetical protein